MVSVTNTFTSSNTFLATAANTNFSDLVTAYSSGNEDYSTANLSCAATFTANSSVCFGTDTVWKTWSDGANKGGNNLSYSDSATVQVESGNYLIGRNVYTLSSDLDWNWITSGACRGTVSGVTENASTWYYVYGVNYNDAFAVVASTTAPTKTHDNALDDYVNNVYLGPFFNDSSSNIVPFAIALDEVHFDDLNGLRGESDFYTKVSATTYNSFADGAPAVANILKLAFSRYMKTSGTSGHAYISADGTTDYVTVYSQLGADTHTVSHGLAQVINLPRSASSVVHAKCENGDSAAAYAEIILAGFKDKYL